MSVTERLAGSGGPAGSAAPTGVPAVAARDLWFSYDGRRPILQAVEFRVEPGTICMILGASGSGKTTLLKVIKGLLRPRRGAVSVFGAAADRRSPQASREIAYIPQHLGLVQSTTVLENVLAGALGRMGTASSLVKAYPQPLLEEARAALASLRIADKAGLKVYTLSGGERQRVAVARALMQRARLVLADEFVSQLDPVRAAEALEEVRRIASQGTTFMVTSHEIDLVTRYGDQAVFLRWGEVAYDGAASDVDLRLAERLMR